MFLKPIDECQIIDIINIKIQTDIEPWTMKFPLK